jgi:hypothetical protein
MVSTLSEISFGLFIPDPDPDPAFLPIPDPGVKKAPDPGSGTLVGVCGFSSICRNQSCMYPPISSWIQIRTMRYFVGNVFNYRFVAKQQNLSTVYKVDTLDTGTKSCHSIKQTKLLQYMKGKIRILKRRVKICIRVRMKVVPQNWVTKFILWITITRCPGFGRTVLRLHMS